MSLEPLPPNLEQGIQRYAAERHISHAEAVRALIASGLEKAEKTPMLGLGRKSTAQKPNLEVAKKKPIIGMFPNDPEFDRAMDEVIARRAERYSDSK